MSCYIIAEAGSNHDCDINVAKQLIDVAKSANCDGVKFQIFSADTLYSSKVEDFDKYQNVYSLIKNLEVSFDFFKELKLYCDEVRIDFLATPFSEEAVDLLVDMNVKLIKLASFEFTDRRLVEYIRKTNKPLVASTGLCSKQDIYDFLQWTEGLDVTLLHCNSAYPTPDEDMNLNYINLLKTFGSNSFKVGLSDHSMGILAPALAVSMGASVIEKHFTLSRNRKGPDHPFAIEPNELNEMVKLIKTTEKMLGKNDFTRTQSESSMSYARRSVICCKNIKKGEVLTYENITTKRPGNGIPASKYYDVIGKKSKIDLQEDHILQWDEII